MAKRLDTEPGQPDYELARAITDERMGVGFFKRSNNTWKQIWIDQARQIMGELDKADHIVTHKANIDGG